MSKITISNLHCQDSQSLLSFLEDKENGVMNIALDRALEARQISGGAAPDPLSTSTYSSGPTGYRDRDPSKQAYQ